MPQHERAGGKAIGFYLDYLEADNAGDFLPIALKSYVDGRLGKLEERLSSLSFRQSVEVDMAVSPWRNTHGRLGRMRNRGKTDYQESLFQRRRLLR